MTGERANLLVPAEVVPRLDVPPLALSTGAPDPVWVDVPVRGRGAVRLPYDAGAATALRRRRRLAPLMVLLAGVALILLVNKVAGLYQVPSGVHLFSSAGLCVAGLARVCWQVPAMPVGVGGDVYLAAVPSEVAEQWIVRNPGVRAVGRRPVLRRFGPRVYQVAAALILIAAVQVVIVLSVTGGAHPAWLWLTAPALVAAGTAVACKSVPFDHVRFGS